MIKRLASLSTFLACLCCLSALAKEPSAGGVDFFEKKIRPVLVRHCYECHSTESREVQGGLLLDNRASAQKGGDSGAAVVPGNVDDSLLIQSIRYETFEMPPSGQLPESVIADFETWVKMGAADPREGAAKEDRSQIDFVEARKFWSFKPLTSIAPPDVKHKEWPRNDIDRFILAAMERKGLEPSEDADARTLLRRAYYDLIGLPPSPDEIEAFVMDSSPAEFAKVVDHLLKSPHFGERWGRHWLDVARFAESSGGGRTLLFKDAWRYRDYVVESINSDKPFDRFMTEQIAGDLMPYKNPKQRAEQLTALGFLVLGPTNYELQDKELLRMEVVDEQIETVGRAFLGQSIGCARCHDHKFDPIPTADYYALAGIFRSTKTLTPGNVSGYVLQELPISPEHRRSLDQYNEKTKPLQARLKKAQASLKVSKDQLAGKATGLVASQFPGIVVDDTDAIFSGTWSSSSGNPSFIGSNYRYASKSSATARYNAPLSEPALYEIRLAYNAHPNRSTKSSVTVLHAKGTTKSLLNQRLPPPIDGLFISLGQFSLAPNAASVVISCEQADGAVIADAIQFLPIDPDQVATTPISDSDSNLGKAAALKRKQKLQADIVKINGEITQTKVELKKLAVSAPPPLPKVMSVHDEKEEIADYHICIRGNIRNTGAEVKRGFLKIVGDQNKHPIAADQSGRLELARWLSDDANPLPSRVFVNRIWRHLFGEGISSTPDNFGSTGATPSHSELLDYLAIEFRQQGWSLKTMIRQIMLSRVYQLSSQSSAKSDAIDLNNRLLSHSNRRRLEAEAIYDTLLLLGENLDLTYGGSAIAPEVKTEIKYQFIDSRRGVYVPVFRNTLHELFEVFDFANPNLVVGDRTTSTLPTQALYLMNSSFVMDQAAGAANSLLKESSLNDEKRIERAYLLTLGRPPSQSERALAFQFISNYSSGEESKKSAQVAAWTAFYQSLFSCIDFRYLK